MCREFLAWYDHKNMTKSINQFTGGFEFRVGAMLVTIFLNFEFYLKTSLSNWKLNPNGENGCIYSLDSL